MNLEEMIDGYNRLREKCLEAARRNPELFGSAKWLRYAIGEEDITLYFIEGQGIECSGVAFTTQTQSNEFFDFIIPLSELD